MLKNIRPAKSAAKNAVNINVLSVSSKPCTLNNTGITDRNIISADLAIDTPMVNIMYDGSLNKERSKSSTSFCLKSHPNDRQY